MTFRAKVKTRILATAGAAAMCAGVTAQGAAAQTPSPADAPPNIMLVILDDIGLDTTTDMYPGLINDLVRQYGPDGLDHPDYMAIQGGPASTPVLDAFASESMIFSNAWAQPFCSPTRASILTGLYAQRTGVLDYTNWLSQTHHSLAQDLKAQGYATAIFGKWHVAGLNDIRPGVEHEGPLYPGMKPKEADFDLFEGNMNGALADYWDYEYQVQDASSPTDEWRVEEPPVRALPGIAPTTYAPVVKIADAIDWITEQEAADPDKPWFGWVAFNLSHITPGQPPSIVPNRDTLDQVAIAEMEACGGEFGTDHLGDCSPGALNRVMTTSMNTVVGKLMEAVDDLDPNTYVIILGDNGTGQYGRPQVNFIDNMYITREGRGKGTGYESGVRVPFAVRGPGVAPGRSDAVVHVADLFSTILELARVTPPSTVPNSAGDAMIPLDSVSLGPILFGREDAVRDPVSGFVTAETRVPLANNQLQVAARNATYKLLCKHDEAGVTDGCWFYDLVDDPLEEYPLDAPESCEGSADADVRPEDPAWHYCHLMRVIETETALADNTP